MILPESQTARNRIVHFGILIVSDRCSRGERVDSSGSLIASLIFQSMHCMEVCRNIIPDEREVIQSELIRLCDRVECDLVVTTGGTGLFPRDLTPEATLSVIDQEIPGMEQAMRTHGSGIKPTAMLSRAICGVRGSTLIVNLSGSPQAVRQQLESLGPALPHALQEIRGIQTDCGE